MSHPVVEIKDLQFAYNRQNVLQDINLSIDPGDFVAMIGPNGGGKTTLLRLMLGLLHPVRGSVKIINQPAEKASHHIGYVPQDVSLNRGFPISVMDVVLMGKLRPGSRWKRNKSRERQEAMETLEKMGMSAYAQRKISELSGGQRQRVFIARALVTNPKLLLLDEPTANVDTEGQADLYKLLKELNKEITILVVSHEWIVISSYVKSVACVNGGLHFHHQPEGSPFMQEPVFPHPMNEICPVELVAHGVPLREQKSSED
ncbi:MAG: ABC transporter ATP-binding protein [Deltaproteobacteria bacterium]|jgi:zinc transport system ATP-binding protein|nr:ABC transporter ATP-binding protein [Deltaproteobacteria bacterium]MBT4266745.1 ABC transporter ATP-binding protein [Deltaproteobacteria bacterium]MBT4641118.1 ABC transporter ATP-binding protein [Deltaproteobacteria bacterium]MBT6505000.1 ABC transporter ATP-binding protein [Deltaproteobacteria bacterium]MBT6613533.1 ABC transporter ATP-binding protein [Deltaproteobacteria bacterium]